MKFDLIIKDVNILSNGEPLKKNYSIGIKNNLIIKVKPSKNFDLDVAKSTLLGKSAICMPGFINNHNHSPIMSVRGMVEDLGFAPAYTPNVPQGHWISEEETFLLSRLGLAEMLISGCTTVVDFYAKPFALIKATKEIGLRTFVGGRIMDVDTLKLSGGEFSYSKKLGNQTFNDNVSLIEKYHNQEDTLIKCVLGPHAADTCSYDLLKQVAEYGHKHKLLIHTHLSQSKMEVNRVKQIYNKTPTELLNDAGILSSKTILAHCIFLDKQEIAIIAKSKSYVSHVPSGNATGGMIAPIKDLLDASIPISIATDTKSADMFEAMRNAIRVARIKNNGKFIFDAKTLFNWATVNGARSLGIEKKVGKIEEGKIADIIILNEKAPNLRPVVDGYGIVVHSGSGQNVRDVILNGEIIVQNYNPLKFNLQEIINDAQKVCDRLWKKAGHQ